MDVKEIVPKPALLCLALLLIGGAVLALEQPWARHSAAPPPPTNLPANEANFPAAPDFAGATGWVNSPPLDLVALRGKVVLVDFWTYSCINCIHTFPYVEGWYERYKGEGFLVVGVHTPEFRFEHDVANIRNATARYHLTYPVAVDNDYGVWTAYNNRYWPADYLIDAYGRIRHTHFGEGDYADSEDRIRSLLTEAGHAPGSARANTPAAPAPMGGLTGELYIGNGDGRGALGNAEGYHTGETASFTMPAELSRDRIYLAGSWAEGNENFTAASEGQIALRFRAGGGNAVLDGPVGACVPVLLDGQAFPGNRATRDVSFDRGAPCIPLDGPRSYDFYAGPVEEHLVEFEVPQGFVLFTFDFASAGRT